MMETAANEFKLIDDTTIPVIVNWENSLTLVERLKSEGPSYTLIKQLSQYSVNLRKRDFDEMLKNGIIDEIITGFFVTKDKNQYHKNVGLLTDNHWLEETYII